METTVETTARKEPFQKLIITVSILIPLVVAILFGVKLPGYDFSFLPPIYATINGVTAVLLLSAVIAVKNRKLKLHQWLINACVILSAAFLVMYVLYHMTSEPTAYGANGAIRYVYFFILITHILLSIVIIPIVLFTYVRGWTGSYEKHKALAKYAFPLWLYVAVTGVVVYLMISPYYQS